MSYYNEIKAIIRWLTALIFSGGFLLTLIDETKGINLRIQDMEKKDKEVEFKKMYVPVARNTNISKVSAALCFLGFYAIISELLKENDNLLSDKYVTAIIFFAMASIIQNIYTIRNQAYLEEIYKITYENNIKVKFERVSNNVNLVETSVEPDSSAQDIADIKKYLGYIIKQNQKKDTQ